ncbi:MAG: glycosyltransferase family 4 protein [Planctomycetota bacterium]
MSSVADSKVSSGVAGAEDHAERRIRLCVVVTVDITLLNLCRGRFEYLTQHGFDITAVCAPTEHADTIRQRGVNLLTAPLTRAITPFRDMSAIWALYRIFRTGNFDIVEVSTPKAALVGSLAARLAGVPRILHLLRGLTYEEQSGLQRMLIKASQTIPCRIATEVISISKSMMNQAIDDGVCHPDRIRVLGLGSSNGVDLDNFRRRTPSERAALRNSLNIPDQAIVVGFVGRMTGDKGITELARAFEQVAESRPDLHMLLVGEYEARDRPSPSVMEFLENHDRVRHVGWQQDTVPYFDIMSFLVLPTYREGFGTVLLEAAAMNLAVITTEIVGCRDAVEPDQTALTVPARDVDALAQAIDRLAHDEELRTQLGTNGRLRVERHFAQEKVWQVQEEALRSLIGNR